MSKNFENKNVTEHHLYLGDGRDMSFIKDESVHLVLTSPPYWNLKWYNEHDAQLGHIDDYEKFLEELTKVWSECYRILTPGGRLICVVGDVCLSRRENGRHVVMPLHSDIAVNCRKLGFDNLNPIIWHKISNANYEVSNGSKFLGKPYEPNAIIKNDAEYILMQRKPRGYRKPTQKQRELSKLTKEEYNKWFQQIWYMSGASTKTHPAPFPLELAYRLIRMFSFTEDTVLDPFCGSGTTIIAAMKCGRNSMGIEIDPEYFLRTKRRLQEETRDMFYNFHIQFTELYHKTNTKAIVGEKKKKYVNRRVNEAVSTTRHLLTT